MNHQLNAFSIKVIKSTHIRIRAINVSEIRIKEPTLQRAEIQIQMHTFKVDKRYARRAIRNIAIGL